MKNEREDDAEVKRIIEDSSAEGRREKYTLALVKSSVLARGMDIIFFLSEEER